MLDAETVPDYAAGRRLFDLPQDTPDEEVHKHLIDHCRKSPDQVDEAVFIKPVLQRVAALALVEATRPASGAAWRTEKVASVHTGQNSEAACLRWILKALAKEPQATILGWNTAGFDLPLLRYRTMALRIDGRTLNQKLPSDMPAWKWEKENGCPPPKDYWKKYSDHHIDLMEVLANWQNGTKGKLVEVAAILGLPGKADGIDGSMVAPMVAAGRVAEVACYCEGDVALLYSVWLRYQLSCGELDFETHAASWASFAACVRARDAEHAHLQPLLHVADLEAAKAPAA